MAGLSLLPWAEARRVKFPFPPGAGVGPVHHILLMGQVLEQGHRWPLAENPENLPLGPVFPEITQINF